MSLGSPFKASLVKLPQGGYFLLGEGPRNNNAPPLFSQKGFPREYIPEQKEEVIITPGSPHRVPRGLPRASPPGVHS